MTVEEVRNNFFRDIPFIIRMVYALCLSGASYNHAMINIEHGLFWDYFGASFLTCIFWTSLTFLDPLAAISLFLRPKFGVLLTVAIIVTDVLHNSWFFFKNGYPSGYAYFAQIAFLIFVLSTARMAWSQKINSVTRTP